MNTVLDCPPSPPLWFGPERCVIVTLVLSLFSQLPRCHTLLVNRLKGVLRVDAFGDICLEESTGVITGEAT